MLKHKIVDFIIQFMEEVDKEISEMKLFVRDTHPQYVGQPLMLTAVSPAERKSAIRSRVLPDSCKCPQILCPFQQTADS